ncbi:Uncharacterised protein [Burkholderia pseudomallei]|nr:Uncharacterised protein [Burkholderia pseudomallei]CAJ4571799.1 Uncharacterised protein [Burkholderia pseudomallei]CAJ5934170.1 Uncharacterised protein [Burkholderia pseudomallei]CAK0507953.1 Uncharacterised protein [Burkholderia pseudomallei]VBR78292.1 Uncharacterised protein [Burkholderia pseudomallei]
MYFVLGGRERADVCSPPDEYGGSVNTMSIEASGSMRASVSASVA